MDPFQWGGDLRRLREHLDPSDSAAGDRMRTSTRPDAGCGYSRYTAGEAHSSTNVAEEHDDSELARKCGELRDIQQKIILKKASIALKSLRPGFFEAETSRGESLRDRVNFLLRQRHPHGVVPKILSPRRRMNPSKDGLLPADHPLKLRVKALMKQRRGVPPVLPPNTEVPDVTSPPPSERVTSPARPETSNMGFQRFLNVLNKGVDINLLSRIVNDDDENFAVEEELLSVRPSAVENNSETGESQALHSSASLPRCSGTDGGERESSLPRREKSLGDSTSLCADEETQKDKKEVVSLSSSRETQSPPTVKKKKKDEEPPMVDKQHEQLQNILKTLGLSLEVEEMSKLADRTQERLYGKKPEGRVDADNQVEQESQQRGADRHCRSTSSSSSSSSSMSTSTSAIPSISPQCPTVIWNTKSSSSGDGDQDSEEAQRPRKTSSYLYQYLQEQAYCNTDPESSGYADYDGAASASDSTDTHPLDDREYPHTEVTDPDFLGLVMAPDVVRRRSKWRRRKEAAKNRYLRVNPDLSKSEGQAGTAAQRYLQVIRPKAAPPSFIKQLVSERKDKADNQTKRETWIQPLPQAPAVQKDPRHSNAYNNQMGNHFNDAQAVQEKYPQGKGDLKTQQPRDVQPPPEHKGLAPDEEIKLNLRRRLEAFNQQVKLHFSQPTSYRTTPNESVDYQDLI